MGKAWWFLLGITPIPIGLLMGPENIFTTFGTGGKGLLVIFVVLTSILSVAAAIGISCSIRKKVFVKVALGLFLSIGMVAFDLSVIFFIGCCSAISNI